MPYYAVQLTHIKVSKMALSCSLVLLDLALVLPLRSDGPCYSDHILSNMLDTPYALAEQGHFYCDPSSHNMSKGPVPLTMVPSIPLLMLVCATSDGIGCMW